MPPRTSARRLSASASAWAVAEPACGSGGLPAAAENDASSKSRDYTAEPVDAGDFAGLMQAFAPFEPRPHVAVAVSGGPDSLALALLTAEWAAARGGRATALTVDHRLRRGSGAEARWVKARLAERGVAHRTLVRRGPPPRTGVQAAARDARYRLLAVWCARHGVLHLALAHHLEDQTETVLLRAARDSGPEGLAGMPAESELAEVRLLRPLLALPKARLEATLRARGLDWLEDPSNRDVRYARVRVRRLWPRLMAGGLRPEGLAGAARGLGLARARLEEEQARVLARAAQVDPAGFAWLDPEVLAGAPDQVSRPALARLLMVVGGGAYPPRGERLARLHAHLDTRLTRARTLGGCRVLPRRGRWLVVREPARAERQSVAPGARLVWDGRYEVWLSRSQERSDVAWELAPLGDDGWREVVSTEPVLKATRVPPPARPALMAVKDSLGVREVPALGYRRGECEAAVAACSLAPPRALSAPAFTVASG